MFSLQNSIGTIHAQVKPIESSDSPNTIVDTSRVTDSKCPVANGGLHPLPNTAVHQTNKWNRLISVRCRPQNVLWQANTSHGPDPRTGRGSTCRPQWRAAEQHYHLAIGQPKSILVLGTGVQDTSAPWALQHANCHKSPRHGPKTFPDSDAGCTCFHAPSTSAGGYPNWPTKKM
jgi:hypothetical protein